MKERDRGNQRDSQTDRQTKLKEWKKNERPLKPFGEWSNNKTIDQAN